MAIDWMHVGAKCGYGVAACTPLGQLPGQCLWALSGGVKEDVGRT